MNLRDATAIVLICGAVVYASWRIEQRLILIERGIANAIRSRFAS